MDPNTERVERKLPAHGREPELGALVVGQKACGGHQRTGRCPVLYLDRREEGTARQLPPTTLLASLDHRSPKPPVEP